MAQKYKILLLITATLQNDLGSATLWSAVSGGMPMKCIHPNFNVMS